MYVLYWIQLVITAPAPQGLLHVTQEAGEIFSQKCWSWFLKPRRHKVKLINIQHSRSQASKPLDTFYIITNKQTFQDHVVFMSTNKQTIKTYWQTMKNHRSSNFPSSCCISEVESWTVDIYHKWSLPWDLSPTGLLFF